MCYFKAQKSVIFTLCDNKQAKVLLALVGKTLSKHYPKNSPRFCQGCIDYLVEHRPDMFAEDCSQPEHSYSSIDPEEPQPKRPHLAEDIGSGTSASGTDSCKSHRSTGSNR